MREFSVVSDSAMQEDQTAGGVPLTKKNKQRDRLFDKSREMSLLSYGDSLRGKAEGVLCARFASGRQSIL